MMFERAMDRVLDILMPPLIIVIVVSATALIFVGIPLVIWREYKAEKFYLRKDEWNCTASHKETTIIYANPGGQHGTILVPITTTHTICDQWSRKSAN